MACARGASPQTKPCAEQRIADWTRDTAVLPLSAKAKHLREINAQRAATSITSLLPPRSATSEASVPHAQMASKCGTLH
eukprot:2470833-Pleurochrysis_carterae.AAC.1